MKYLCMGFHDERAWAAIPQKQREALLQETFQYQGELRKNGHYLDGIALQGVQTASTLRFQAGKCVVTDGPFAETKEQLGGVMLLEARDLNHAIQLMSNLPCMKVGGALEIRPVNEEIGLNVELAAAGSTTR
jgi:hypothetical protein